MPVVMSEAESKRAIICVESKREHAIPNVTLDKYRGFKPHSKKILKKKRKQVAAPITDCKRDVAYVESKAKNEAVISCIDEVSSVKSFNDEKEKKKDDENSIVNSGVQETLNPIRENLYKYMMPMNEMFIVGRPKETKKPRTIHPFTVQFLTASLMDIKHEPYYFHLFQDTKSDKHELQSKDNFLSEENDKVDCVVQSSEINLISSDDGGPKKPKLYHPSSVRFLTVSLMDIRHNSRYFHLFKQAEHDKHVPSDNINPCSDEYSTIDEVSQNKVISLDEEHTVVVEDTSTSKSVESETENPALSDLTHETNISSQENVAEHCLMMVGQNAKVQDNYISSCVEGSSILPNIPQQQNNSQELMMTEKQICSSNGEMCEKRSPHV